MLWAQRSVIRWLGGITAVIGRRIVRDIWSGLERDLRIMYLRYLTLKHLIPPVLPAMLIIAEDRRFYRHHGLDPIAIGRAAYCLAARRQVTGASTIEQQLIRTVTRRYERNARRKIREILLACSVEKVIPKRDIPGVYLSVAYFGWQMTGIQQACRRLGIELAKMTPVQAASIVARLKYPEQEVMTPRRAQQITRRTAYLLRRVAKYAAAAHPPAWADALAFSEREAIRQAVIAAAERHGVPLEIAVRMAFQESGFNPSARGAVGEVGVMQLMPDTARYLRVDPTDAAQNIEGGIRYLRELWDTFHDWTLAVAAYNAGGTSAGTGKWLLSAGVRNYVESVLGRRLQRSSEMRFKKDITVAATPQMVWPLLRDVERMARCLPACQEVRTVVPHERYEAVVSQRIGPFKIRFPVSIQIMETEEPLRLKAVASAQDASMDTSLRVSFDLRLEAMDTGSRLVIASDANIIGKLGALGRGVIQQKIERKADELMTQFAQALQKQLPAEGTATG